MYLRPEKQIELLSVVIFIWLIDFWTPFLPMTCFAPRHMQVSMIFGVRRVWMKVLVWVGRTLPFLNGMLSCGVYSWLKLAFKNCWLKTLWWKEKEGFGQTEDFVFCFLRALCSACRIFCELSESLAAESFWYSSIVSHLASDLSAILINLFIFISLSLMDFNEEWTDSASLFSTWSIDSWMSSKIST